MGSMGGIEWFWAIVCNAMVIGGAVAGGLLMWYWWVSVPHGYRSTGSKQ